MNPAVPAITPLLMAALSLAGCAAGPDYTARPPALPAAFDSAVPSKPVAAADAVPDAEWWKSFDDAELEALVQRAVSSNHDIRIAVANLRASRALLREVGLERLPIVTAGGSVTREKQSAALGIPVLEENDYYDAGFDAVWEIDLFGRVQRSVEAFRADYAAEESSYRDTLRSVTAEVARVYVELRGAQYRLDVARRNMANQEDTYALTQALLEGGRGTDLDIARALAQLETTRASIGPLEAAVAESINRLAVLAGATPGELRPALAVRKALPRAPELVSVADPASLLRRRPDIRLAERQLAAATARIGVAAADYFPRVTLTGSAGWRGTSLSDLGDADAERYRFGPSISWAFLDLGRVRARVEAADARSEAALANYEQTVLIALEETESALSRYARAQESSARLRIAADASGRAAELARLRYRNGADSFLTVLDAERRLLEAEDLLANAETDATLSAVAVYKALGGGWQSFAAEMTAR